LGGPSPRRSADYWWQSKRYGHAGGRVMRTVSSALPALAHKLREVLEQSGAPKPDAAQKTFGFTKITYGVNTPYRRQASPPYYLPKYER